MPCLIYTHVDKYFGFLGETFANKALFWTSAWLQGEAPNNLTLSIFSQSQKGSHVLLNNDACMYDLKIGAITSGQRLLGLGLNSSPLSIIVVLCLKKLCKH